MLSTVALIIALVAFMPASAFAQTYDHLKCYKVRDARTFSKATAALSALEPEFGMEDCTIKGRAKKLCIPADKAVTSIDGGVVQPLAGEELTFLRLCYKLKCPRNEIPGEEVSDQFGTRTVEKFKAVELCTPAVLGPAPTTSTTTSTTMSDSFSDGFDGGMLDLAWMVLNPGRITTDVSAGALHLEPTMSGTGNTWFNDGEGGLVHKSLTGDFDVSVVISTEDSTSPGDPPPPEYRLAGILARDPASSAVARNSVHVALGSGANAEMTSYEYKSTDDSVSTWATTPTASPDGELRLVRLGSMFEMFWRPDSGSGWTSIYMVDRPDLPATLEVGMMVYSTDAPPSIRASFDEITLN